MDENTHRESRSLKDTFKSGSADEVRDRVKETVEKGVAAVAGALQGFNERTKSSDLPEKAKTAVHQAAETTKSAVSSIAEEARGLKEPLREAGQTLSDTARDLRSGAREQIDETKSALRGGGQGTQMPDISRTPMAQSDSKLAGKDLLDESE